MSDKQFVDTNILVYGHDRTAGAKHQLARALIEQLWNSGSGILSTQVLQELCVCLRQRVRPALPDNEVRELIRDYLSWEIVVNTGESVIQALDVEARYQVSFWDALILQSARQSGASVLYSEDFSNRQHYGPLQVVNPFIENLA